MSYDYNALVLEISQARRRAMAAKDDDDDDDNQLTNLQQAVEGFETLSSHCPMTPLLWMQYASDTAQLLRSLGGGAEAEDDENNRNNAAAMEARLQLLELGLAEFPGSAILHLHYIQLLVAENSTTPNKERIRQALDTALANVGKGSHRNEGVLIAPLYRLDAKSHMDSSHWEEALESFYQRARTPMKDVNEGLNHEVQEFCETHGKQMTAEMMQQIEMGRRYESKFYNPLVLLEDEVDVAMHAEGILPRHQVDLETLDWDNILQSDDKTFWMGLGGMTTATAFIKYAQACYRYRLPRGSYDRDDKDAMQTLESIQRLALSVFERGVAECPTAETLWTSYIRHVHYLVEKDTGFLPRLQSIVDRAVRNCPYSLALYQQKLYTQLLSAEKGLAVLDPDELMKVVQGALASKFIASPEACLELYMTALQVMKRRILSLLVTSSSEIKKMDGAATAETTSKLAYDDAEPIQVTLPNVAAISDQTTQELEDLCDDMKDMYDAVDNFLRKNHSAFASGRARLWSDRNYTETYLLGPLADALGDETSTQADTTMKRIDDLVKSYDKLTKVCQPAHPDTFAHFIQGFLGFLSSTPLSNPYHVLSKLRQVRTLYEKGLKSVGKPKHVSPPLDPIVERDYEIALRSLCHDYLVFERYFGSDKSLANASKAIQKKLAKLTPIVDPTADSSNATANNTQPVKHTTQQGDADHNGNKKRPQEDSALNDHPSKKLKTGTPTSEVAETGAQAETMEETKKTTLQMEKVHVEKVNVGGLEYPAHPFTVRVFNLSKDTEDMDLVDVFRDKCGAIVHAKIMREKSLNHHKKAQSKGWGLVQFEDRESAEKALDLSEVIGIKERLVKIERSHMPAVGLVPPGMHRINPKGAGRNTKLNQKRKEQTKPPPSKWSKTNAATKDQEKAGPKSGSAAGTGEPKKANPPSVLAFTPRGVRHGQQHRKVKLSLADEKKKIMTTTQNSNGDEHVDVGVAGYNTIIAHTTMTNCSKTVSTFTSGKVY